MLPGELIPMLGMLTGTLVTGMMVVGAVLIFRGPIGQAIGRRIHNVPQADDPAVLRELDQVRDHVAMLEAQVGELTERLDFTERLLARQDQPRLAGGGPE